MVSSILLAAMLIASPLEVDVWGASYHTGRSPALNEFNAGIGISMNGWTVGGLNDSDRNVDIYAGRRFMYKDTLGVAVGAVLRRDNVYPYILPTLRIGSGAVKLNLFYIPYVPEHNVMEAVGGFVSFDINIFE